MGTGDRAVGGRAQRDGVGAYPPTSTESTVATMDAGLAQKLSQVRKRAVVWFVYEMEKIVSLMQ